MRSIPGKFRLPCALEAAAKARATEAGYKGLSEYALGLLRYDLLTRKPHDTTANLSKLGRSEQDKVDAEIAKMFESGETLGGGWFQHQISEAVKASSVAEPEQSKIVTEILRRLAGGK